jgi:hypothetical protein
LILIPVSRAGWVGVATPQIDNNPTRNSDANGPTNFGVLVEVIEKGLSNRLESRINKTMRDCAIAQRADFSRM